MPGAANVVETGAPPAAIGLSKLQLALVERTLCASVVPANDQVTVSETLTVTAFGDQRLSLASGSVPSPAWIVCSAAAVAGRRAHRPAPRRGRASVRLEVS